MSARFLSLTLSLSVVFASIAAFAQQAAAPLPSANAQGPGPGVGRHAASYVVGAQDVLSVTVWDQADLGGKFSVETDGSFTFPYIGRVRVGGLTLRAVEELLVDRLKKGLFFKDPQLTVGVDQYRSQRVFVLGEVRVPGTYPLTGDMSLIEVLARAGSITAEAGGEVLVLRGRPGQTADAPATLPSALDATATDEVIRLDIKELHSGLLSQNIQLYDGDTIHIPRAELIYVYGQVNSPGGYPLRKGTTVLQALSLAGGMTDRGATGRIRIVRVVAGKQSEDKAKLEDVVQPGDTITVGERFF